MARESGNKSPDGEMIEMSPSLHLLLQFQRLLVARIFSKEMAVMTKSAETKEEEDFAKPTSEIGEGLHQGKLLVVLRQNTCET